VPIAAVADSNGQSPLPLVRQVGASRDLSEATRRGAVRALWGTVTRTQRLVPLVFPVASISSIIVSGSRDIPYELFTFSIDLSLELWTIL